MQIVFGLLGGLSIFIFGMQSMGEGLQKIAGDKLRKILKVLTGVPVIGVTVGAIVTAIIQSSSATTVMVVGFVNAGLMSLKQAVSVIMGANIGTTITAQLIAFKISHYFLPIIAIGFGLNFFSKKKSTKYLGQVLFGFGLLLMGLSVMGNSMNPLREFQGFRDFMANFSHFKILGVGVGIVMTMLIQSSSATIGILIVMATQGLLPLDAALPILLGDNIGTCITSVFASIGTNLSAKRAAFAHVVFNVAGAIVFLILMPYFKIFVLSISSEGDIARQIANAHTSFNVLNTLIFLPFISTIVSLVTKLVPGEEKIIKNGPIYLDERMLNSPAIAISLANMELTRMGELASESLDNAMKAFINNDEKLLKEVYNIEEVINELEEDITDYLAKLSQKGLTESVSTMHSGLLHAVNDIERIGDHAENIAELASVRIEDNISISEHAERELQNMHDFVLETLKISIQALRENDDVLAKKVLENEPQIDEEEKRLRRSHIGRLNEGQCIPHAGVVFLDIISNLERVGDHSNNIAHVVLNDV